MIEHKTVINNRYRVAKLLGKGGFGEIFEVDDEGTPKVIKILNLDSLYEPGKRQTALSLFQRECEILKLLNHPGIPRVESDGYFTWQDGTKTRHCLVMEKIDGQNLENWFQERNDKFITQEQAIEWLKQLLEIVEYLHKHNYIHRDIKPPNIMVKPNGQLVLIDFGGVKKISDTYLAKLVDNVEATRLCTDGYTPREQMRGKPIKQSDFFALGCTLVYLLTGISPLELDEDDSDLLIWRHHAPTVRDNIADLIDKMIAPLHRERPQDTQIIFQYLEALEKKHSVVEDKPTYLYVNNRDKIEKKLSASLKYSIAKSLDISSFVKAAIAANNRGIDYYNKGDLTQAKKEFDLAIKIQPDNAASYYNQAWSYERFGDFNHAIKLYRKAASHGFAAAYCNLVRLHIIEDKKYDLAVDICGQGLKLVKEDIVETDKIVKAALLTYLSWAWIELGLYEEALEKLQEALELDSDRASTHALIAQALENLGYRTEAGEAWKNYVNKYPKCDSRDKGVWMGMARKRLKELSCTSPTNGNLD